MGQKPEEPGGKGPREAHTRLPLTHLHVLLFDADQHGVDARLLGGIGDTVGPILVILYQRSDWAECTGGSITTHSPRPTHCPLLWGVNATPFNPMWI